MHQLGSINPIKQTGRNENRDAGETEDEEKEDE